MQEDQSPHEQSLLAAVQSPQEFNTESSRMYDKNESDSDDVDLSWLDEKRPQSNACMY